MKKQILILCIATAIVSNLQAQDIPQSQVPSVVANQFSIDFPKAKDVEWELKNDVYNVDFEQGWSKDFEAWYSANGTLIRLEEELLSKSELPKAVITSIEEKFPTYRIDDVTKITKNEEITYKVEIEKGNQERSLYFNENGTIIK